MRYLTGVLAGAVLIGFSTPLFLAETEEGQENVDDYRQQGEELYREGRYREAQAAFRKALETLRETAPEEEKLPAVSPPPRVTAPVSPPKPEALPPAPAQLPEPKVQGVQEIQHLTKSLEEADRQLAQLIQERAQRTQDFEELHVRISTLIKDLESARKRQASLEKNRFASSQEGQEAFLATLTQIQTTHAKVEKDLKDRVAQLEQEFLRQQADLVESREAKEQAQMDLLKARATATQLDQEIIKNRQILSEVKEELATVWAQLQKKGEEVKQLTAMIHEMRSTAQLETKQLKETLQAKEEELRRLAFALVEARQDMSQWKSAAEQSKQTIADLQEQLKLGPQQIQVEAQQTKDLLSLLKEREEQLNALQSERTTFHQKLADAYIGLKQAKLELQEAKGELRDLKEELKSAQARAEQLKDWAGAFGKETAPAEVKFQSLSLAPSPTAPLVKVYHVSDHGDYLVLLVKGMEWAKVGTPLFLIAGDQLLAEAQLTSIDKSGLAMVHIVRKISPAFTIRENDLLSIQPTQGPRGTTQE